RGHRLHGDEGRRQGPRRRAPACDGRAWLARRRVGAGPPRRRDRRRVARGLDLPRPQILSIPERLDAHPKYSGPGVGMALVDSGFHPPRALMRPNKRIKAYADAARETPVGHEFSPPQVFAWPGPMTACVAAGNGYVSGGRYRGLASEAEVVLVKAS